MIKGQGEKAGAIRLAFATWGISHFEVPMFRLIEGAPSVELRVFYLLDPSDNRKFDADYAQGIDWGESMLGGYESTRCRGPHDLRARIREWRPDAVMVYGYSWPGALRLIAEFRARGIPLVFRGTLSPHVDPRAGNGARMTRRLRWIFFHLFRSLHFGGTYSEAVLRAAGVHPRRLFFVPFSVDSRFFADAADAGGDGGRARFLEGRGWPANAKLALFIGQLSWVKGPDLAIEAFREWSRTEPLARLMIVGSGGEAATLRSAVNGLANPDHVHFAGFCPSKETSPYYLRSDVVIVTSRYETWARAANEAMLCRRPCIVNDRVAACGGLVEDGVTGMVLSDAGPRAFADALGRFFALPEEARVAMGEAARTRALQFSYEEHERELLESICFAAGREVQATPGRAG